MRIVHLYFEEKNIDHEIRSDVFKFLEYKFKGESRHLSINKDVVLNQVTLGFKH